MNPWKVGAWCLIFLGLISPIVASGYLLVKYPMALKGFFIRANASQLLGIL
jgi:hypothetical protein